MDGIATGNERLRVNDGVARRFFATAPIAAAGEPPPDGTKRQDDDAQTVLTACIRSGLMPFI